MDEVPGGILKIEFLDEFPDRISGGILGWTFGGIFKWNSWNNHQLELLNEISDGFLGGILG